jgi:hypothetical protein
MAVVQHIQVAEVEHSKVVAGPTVADHIAMVAPVAIAAGPQGVAHIVAVIAVPLAEVALVAIVDYP